VDEYQVQIDPEGAWVSLEEAAHRLGLKVDTVRKKVRKGGLIARQSPRPQGYVWEVYLVGHQVADQVSSEVDPAVPGTDLVALTALMERLAEENRRLSEQNVQLAGQLGFTTAQLQAKDAQLQAAHEQIALLEAPKEAEGFVKTLDETPSAPWWRWWRR
jgi:hypothetical protein